jgi:2-methylcitrate dehydratase PrpD
MSQPAYTAKFAEHIVQFNQTELTSGMIQQTKRVLLDYLCAAITGAQTDVSQLLYRYLAESEGEGKYNAIGYPKKLSKANAAFLNGTSAHCLDFDDGHTDGSIHPGAVVIPAVLAAAQDVKPTPEKLIRAIVIGYDVCLRIAAAMHPASRQRGFHNTPTAGIFGATAALAYLHDLNKEETQEALGVTGSFAGGLFAFLGTGSEVKRIHPGQAARDAIVATELVRRGLSGPRTVLENQNGFFKAMAGGEINEERMFRGLGSDYEIMNIYIKPYPCCRHLHVAMDAIFEMKAQGAFRAEQVNKLRIGVNKMASLHSHKVCENLLDAQMSLPYAVAAAVVHERLSVDHFEPKAASEELWRVCHAAEIYIDEEAERIYPKHRASRIVIELTDGTEISSFTDTPLGEPSKPLSDEQLKLKFYDNCAPIIGSDQAQSLIDYVDRLEDTYAFLEEI